MNWTTYSDASCYDQTGRGGYGIVVMQGTQEIHSESGPLDVPTTFHAEIEAMIAAMRHVPDNSIGNAITDLKSLPDMIAGRCRSPRKNKSLQQLRHELERTGLKVHFVSPRLRPREYHQCHRMANVFRLYGKFGSVA